MSEGGKRAWIESCENYDLRQENAKLRERLSKISNLLWHCKGLTDQDNQWIKEAVRECDE